MHFFVVAWLLKASASVIDIRRNIIFVSSFLDNGIVGGKNNADNEFS